MTENDPKSSVQDEQFGKTENIKRKTSKSPKKTGKVAKEKTITGTKALPKKKPAVKKPAVKKPVAKKAG